MSQPTSTETICDGEICEVCGFCMDCYGCTDDFCLDVANDFEVRAEARDCD